MKKDISPQNNRYVFHGYQEWYDMGTLTVNKNLRKTM